MFAKAFLVALLSLSLTTASLAVPTADRFPGNNNNQKGETAQCATAVTTVTVTARAASSAAATNIAISTGSKGTSGNNNNSKGTTGNNNTGKGGAAGNNNDKGSNNDNSKNGKGNTSVSSAAAAATSKAAAGNNAASGNNGAAGNNGKGTAASSSAAAASTSKAGAGANTGNEQTSFTLDPKVVADGFNDPSGNDAVDQQSPSLLSPNNFINFCATTGQPITNGQQIKTGSCNPAPMGQIPAATKLVAAKFQNPANLQVVQANKDFNIDLAITNMQLGVFVNATSKFMSAPQQLNGAGEIIGHTHVVIDLARPSWTDTTVLDGSKFTFFKGINTPAKNGVVSVTVPGGVDVGCYRLASINTASNHQPVLMPVAQHASTDDVVYFEASADGKTSVCAGKAAAAATASNNNNNSKGGAAAASSAAPAASSSAAANNNNKGGAAAANPPPKVGGLKGGKPGNGKRRLIL
ncbi:hypothetical protein BDW22DRAFT_1383310 [Trametopsis cervina]|nr:hypothetical protein BDW22DRAFT_1383310 [Trametopsis cervina]